jgi:hypothetical protein
VNRKLQTALIILAVIALFFILAILQSVNTRLPVYGDFGSVDVISSSEVRIQIVGFFSERDYSGYHVVVDPPGYGTGLGELEGWDLDMGTTFFYNSTLILRMVDGENPEGMSEGDYIRIESIGHPLASGQWHLSLSHEGYDVVISTVYFTI